MPDTPNLVTRYCVWCNRSFQVVNVGRGRPKQYCKAGCRTMAARARRAAGWPPDPLKQAAAYVAIANRPPKTPHKVIERY